MINATPPGFELTLAFVIRLECCLPLSVSMYRALSFVFQEVSVGCIRVLHSTQESNFQARPRADGKLATALHLALLNKPATSNLHRAAIPSSANVCQVQFADLQCRLEVHMVRRSDLTRL
jgi:hypothetical protein